MQLDDAEQRRTGKRAAVRRFVARIIRRQRSDEADHESIEARLAQQQRARPAAWRKVAVSLAAAVAMRTCFAPRIAHAVAKTATPDTVLVDDVSEYYISYAFSTQCAYCGSMYLTLLLILLLQVDEDDYYGYDRSLYSSDEDVEEQTTTATAKTTATAIKEQKKAAATATAPAASSKVAPLDDEAAAVAARQKQYEVNRKVAATILPIMFMGFTLWKANETSSKTMREQRKRVRVENTKFNQVSDDVM
jgi:hypothetical protein